VSRIEYVFLNEEPEEDPPVPADPSRPARLAEAVARAAHDLRPPQAVGETTDAERIRAAALLRSHGLGSKIAFSADEAVGLRESKRVSQADFAAADYAEADEPSDEDAAEIERLAAMIRRP
jgi:hypothetical protein